MLPTMRYCMQKAKLWFLLTARTLTNLGGFEFAKQWHSVLGNKLGNIRVEDEISCTLNEVLGPIHTLFMMFETKQDINQSF